MEIKISEDQNTLTVDGVIYNPLPEQQWQGCRHCAFDDIDSCKHPLGTSWANTACTVFGRKDGKSIIWVKRSKK